MDDWGRKLGVGWVASSVPKYHMAPRHSSSSALAERVVTPLGVVAPPPIHIQSPKFEGSLATLFTCVRDHKIDLRDVPLLPICEAYLTYMLAEVPNLDEAAAALAALSYLLERKAWLLLPVHEEEPEPEELLELPVSTIYEYGIAIEALRSWHEDRAALFFRASNQGPNPYELPYELEEVAPDALVLAFKRLLDRSVPNEELPRPRMARSLAEEMRKVLLATCYEWRSLETLAPVTATREDVVYWFLSLLELMRMGQVQARVVDGEAEFCRA